MRTIQLVSLLVALMFGGCGNLTPTPYDGVFDELGQVAITMDAIEAKEGPEDAAGRTVSGRDIVAGCLAFYDPASTTASLDVDKYLATYSHYVYRTKSGGAYKYPGNGAQIFLTEICHLVWLRANGYMPQGMPSPHDLEPSLWNAGLFPGVKSEWKPAIPDIGDTYEITGVDVRATLADAWKISKKFVRPGETRRDTAVRILRWVKAEVPSSGHFIQWPLGLSSLEYDLAWLTSSNTVTIGYSVWTLLRSVGIPVVLFTQESEYGGFRIQIWLPEESGFVDLRLLLRFPAQAADKAILTAPMIAYGRSALEDVVANMYALGNWLPDIYISQIRKDGTQDRELIPSQTSLGLWNFFDLRPGEVAQLNRELPRLTRTNGFKTAPRLTFAQMIDPNFPLD